jgi:hypothetical protein
MGNTLLDFAEHQRSLGRKISPELLQVGRRIEEQKEAKQRYANRDIWCRIGLHSRRRSWTGASYWGTCVKCWRDKL